MFKNIQFKIILIFFLIGILIISGLGVFFLNSLDNLNMQIQNGQVNRLGRNNRQHKYNRNKYRCSISYFWDYIFSSRSTNSNISIKICNLST